MKIFAFIASLLVSLSVCANDQPYKTFGDVRVYYSAFNSSFISPDVANAYNIVRGKDRGLVNIAVVPEGTGHGTAALVGGTASNLLAQQQTLEFTEIREGDAIYYLAPFRFSNEDPLSFTIHVRPANADSTNTFTFKRTFHWD